MRDPYQVLGLKKEASEADIKKAFRRLAKQHHPDRKSDDPNSKERFNEASMAYEILGDATKRAKFDRGEIDAEGKPRFQGFEGFGTGRPGPGARGPQGQHFEFDIGGGPFGGRGFDPSDMFSQFFAQQGGAPGARPGPRPQAPAQGEDLSATLELTLAEATEGATRRIRIGSEREVDVTVPAGVEDRKVMRLRGLGRPGRNGGAPGDVMLTIKVAHDERFAVEGKNIRVRVPVPLETAVLGGAVRVPTLTGEAEMQVPPMTSGNRVFRLRGRGLGAADNRGDLLVAIDIMLPASDDDLTALMSARKVT